MNIKNEIKSYLAATGITMTELVERLNKDLPENKKTSVQNLSNKLSRGSLRYDEAQQIAIAIGKRIEWIDNKKDDGQ
ncbi:LLM class flavin-dependent oxidoreductase [Lysinibacillus boronitolerans]|uniref:LLM class flavin-dependent oxidoreductase n=1 Tax=Lysinibacillus boronitolerans TaxID=309788 RepID=UPI0028A02567|nr:LLM class flavin-dependent oxidoreductase [Lysinibacillus boronitolerans]